MSLAELRFRNAALVDAQAVSDLVNSGYRGDASRVGWTTEADYLEGKRTDAGEIAALVAAPDTIILVCEQDREIIGSVQLQRTGMTAYLGMFVVKPVLQGKGIGKQFMAAAEATVRQAWGVTKMQMTVITLRQELLAYYERRGYRRTGIRKPFPVEDARSTLTVPNLEFEVLEKNLIEPVRIPSR